MEIFQDGELEEEMRKRDFQANSIGAVWQLFSTSYHEAIRALTCPVRATYSLTDLGPTQFTLDVAAAAASSSASMSTSTKNKKQERGVLIQRDDLQLTNPRGETLECSFWHRTSAKSKQNPLSCIVYLHGMSSSRKECVYLRDRILAAGFNLFTFDFSGSGLSGGDRMSYGHFEKDDLRTVLDYLFATNKASRVGLWGRCIGGAAALLYLCESLEFTYKKFRVPLAEAQKLQIGQCRYTGNLLCMRPGRVFRFRVSQLSAANGDFVILSIGGRMVQGLDVEACKNLLIEAASRNDTVEICGYEKQGGQATLGAARTTHSTEQEVASLVFALALDSTFGDMERVIADMLMEVGKSAEKRNVSFPAAMIAAASKVISRSVRRTAGFQFRDIAVLNAVQQLAKVPCQFVSASKVDFIRPEHTRAIYDNYGGEKDWLPFEGVHDHNRPDDVVDKVCQHFAIKWREHRLRSRHSV